MLRMSHPRQVGMQNDGEVSGHHRSAQGMACGGGRPGVPGCEPTPPRVRVCRASVSVACRASDPRDETATIGSSKRPSGRAHRKVNEPSGRRAIGRPERVTRAPGWALPKITTSAFTRNQKSSCPPEPAAERPTAEDEIPSAEEIPRLSWDEGAQSPAPPDSARLEALCKANSELPGAATGEDH